MPTNKTKEQEIKVDDRCLMYWPESEPTIFRYIVGSKCLGLKDADPNGISPNPVQRPETKAYSKYGSDI